jgi:hypothetical protein
MEKRMAAASAVDAMVAHRVGREGSMSGEADWWRRRRPGAWDIAAGCWAVGGERAALMEARARRGQQRQSRAEGSRRRSGGKGGGRHDRPPWKLYLLPLEPWPTYALSSLHGSFLPFNGSVQNLFQIR